MREDPREDAEMFEKRKRNKPPAKVRPRTKAKAQALCPIGSRASPTEIVPISDSDSTANEPPSWNSQFFTDYVKLYTRLLDIFIVHSNQTHQMRMFLLGR